MATVASRRPVMTLYTGARDPHSHRARIVLAEKNITADVIEVESGSLPEDLIDLNPYNSLPTLVDRDLVLYDSHIIMEYLDERYPHPPLMPVDPVARARTKLYIYRMERDWYQLLSDIESGDEKLIRKARQIMRDDLTLIAPIFQQKPYFMSDEFSMVDCTLAPLLWRLEHYGVELPAQAKPLQEYAKRIFQRASFKASLTEAEKELR